MRTDKAIDYQAPAIVDNEVLIRLLCSPLYYDETTGQINVDAFDLRMLGRLQNQPEHYASIGRDMKFANDDERQRFLQGGYAIWDDKDWNPNSYFGHCIIHAGEARAVSDRIEFWPLKGGADYHIGLFYAKSFAQYFKGPLPKEKPEILAMLAELAELAEANVFKAQSRVVWH